MGNRLVCGMLCCLASSLAFAQDNFCRAAVASTNAQADGITVQKVTLSGPWGSNEATVFIPDKEVAGVVFSHSTIKAEGREIDMTPEALTLARAGAAVIVPDRKIIWPPTEVSSNREGGVVICAARWLMTRTPAPRERVVDGRVYREPYGYVGPNICDPNEPSGCRLMTPFQHDAWALLAENERGGDHVPGMISHGSGVARSIQKLLRLDEIHKAEGASKSPD